MKGRMSTAKGTRVPAKGYINTPPHMMPPRHVQGNTGMTTPGSVASPNKNPKLDARSTSAHTVNSYRPGGANNLKGAKPPMGGARQEVVRGATRKASVVTHRTTGSHDKSMKATLGKKMGY